MAVRGIVKRSWMKQAIHGNRDVIREKLDIGRGEQFGWDINRNADVMKPSFSLEQYCWYYLFGKRPEWYGETEGEEKKE